MKINLLVSLDENYLPQLRVMLASMFLNNPGVVFDVYLLHSGIAPQRLARVERDLAAKGHTFYPILVDSALFKDAPVIRYYSQEMYYRLMAAELLPKTIDRILYLDPDILILNSVVPLWQTDLEGKMFAAAAHSGKSELADGVNRLRLGTEQRYFNSGVLLMDLARCREEIRPAEVFDFVENHLSGLFLPDQDVLNALYGHRIKPVDDFIWNYDARNYSEYLLRSCGKANVPWVMSHTAVLHFCGRAKPWKPRYRHRFGVLYLHYCHLADLILPPGGEPAQQTEQADNNKIA